MKAAVVIFIISSFILYQYLYIKTGIKENELYFISSGIAIASLALFSMRKTDTIFSNSILILGSSFFASIVFIYIKRWVVSGIGTTNYYTAISVATIFTFVYLIIYAIKHIRHRKH